MLPTQYITSLQNNSEVSNIFKMIHQMGFFSRKINQYERMVRYSLEKNKPMEVCSEKEGQGLSLVIKDHSEGIKENRRIKLEYVNSDQSYYILRNLRFPVNHLYKKDMNQQAKENNFLDILELTHSCWFPKKDKPCGKCNMCKERII